MQTFKPFQQNKQEYLDNGYTAFDKYLSKYDVDGLNEVIDDLETRLPIGEEVFDENNTGKIKQIQYLWKHGQIFQNLLEKMTDLGAKILGHNDFKVLNMQLFEKHPEISKPTRAHQDNAYFKLTPTTALTIWIALDDIDEENGCIYYAPKTHITPTHKHSRYHPHTTFRVRSGVPGLSLCLHEHPEETDIPVSVEKGDILVHNCNLIHRAGKNNSKSRRRRAIGVVIIPNECKIDPLLQKYHDDRLREDIELQKVKNPGLYNDLKQKFNV